MLLTTIKRSASTAEAGMMGRNIIPATVITTNQALS
jgi:hypothetical protein